MRDWSRPVNAPDNKILPDVQSFGDGRNIAITRVGVKDLRYPLNVQGESGPLPTIARVDMWVALPADRKGTHMSRFIEVLHAEKRALDLAGVESLVRAMLRELESGAGGIELRFPYFIEKAAPISGVRSLMDYEVTFAVDVEGAGARRRQKLVVPVTSLCPCSKEVALYGAHNQRSHLALELELGGELRIEEQVRFAEDAASSELWAVLKRTDEKFVTERAFDNPKFVEDTVRDLALALHADARVLAYRVEAENFESIHNHSAYALIERDKRRAAGA